MGPWLSTAGLKAREADCELVERVVVQNIKPSPSSRSSYDRMGRETLAVDPDSATFASFRDGAR